MPPGMRARTALDIARIAAIVIVLDAAIFFFRLGWFLPIVWTAGLFIALLTTKHVPVGHGRWAGAAAIALIYMLLTVIAWRLLFDRKADVEFEMTWTDRGADNSFAEPEIVLDFTQFPGHSIGFYSRRLEQLLESGADSSVTVVFETRSDFGCLRGYREVSVAGMEPVESSWSYTRSSGSAPSPWGARHWWCP